MSRNSDHRNDVYAKLTDELPSGSGRQSTSGHRPRRELVVRGVADLLERQPVRRDDGDAWVSAAVGKHLAGQPIGRRPSPTASIAPTSARTMLWQNASASTGRRRARPRRVASDKLVQGPDRGCPFALPAERREVVLAEQARRGRVHRSRSSGRWCQSTSCRRSGSTPYGVSATR